MEYGTLVLVLLELLGCGGKPGDTESDADLPDAGDTAVDTGPDTDDTAAGDTGADSDADSDGVLDADDCDPSDSTVHAGALEACNSRDDDCDDRVDEGYVCDTGWVFGSQEWEVSVDAGNFVSGLRGVRWRNKYGENVCELVAGFTTTGAAAPGCPDCVWSFSVAPGTYTLSGPWCDRIPFPWDVDDNIERWNEHSSRYTPTSWGFSEAATIEWGSDEVAVTDVVWNYYDVGSEFMWIPRFFNYDRIGYHHVEIHDELYRWGFTLYYYQLVVE